MFCVGAPGIDLSALLCVFLFLRTTPPHIRYPIRNTDKLSFLQDLVCGKGEIIAIFVLIKKCATPTRTFSDNVQWKQLCGAANMKYA